MLLGLDSQGALSRLRQNHFQAQWKRIFEAQRDQEETTGCSKKPSSWGLSEGAKPPERTLVREEAERLRTPLVAFFSILLA